MDDEISEKAKQALLDASRLRAIRRLERDGAQSTAALHRRVRALAQERNIPPADTHKLMYKRIGTPALMAFCKKYRVSYDWLLAGDLKGLKRMTQDRHLCEVKPKPKPESFKEKLSRLSKPQREVVREMIDQLLEGAS
jgi:hypothetical protein